MSDSTPHFPNLLRKTLKTAAIASGCLLAAIFIMAVVLTVFLTPGNLTRIINREASGYFDADFEVSNARFTLWTSFPHFYIEIDSLRITSRTLRDASPGVRSQLPADADFLASTGRLRGSVNIVKLLTGSVWIRDLEIDRLNINLVALNDSVNNYNIIPRSADKDFGIPYFTAQSIRLRNPQPIRFFSAATKTEAVAHLRNVVMVRDREDRDKYRIRISGVADADVRKVKILSGFPFGMSGNVQLRFHPFRVAFSNFAMNLGNTRGRLDMDLDLGKNMRVNDLNYQIQTFDISRFLKFIPGIAIPSVSGLSADLSVNASARLTEPYSPSASSLPSFEICFNIPQGSISYSLSDRRSFSMIHSPVAARFAFDGKNVGRSHFEIAPMTLLSDAMIIRASAEVDSLLSHPEIKANVSVKANLDRSGILQGISKSYALSGNLNADASIRFQLDQLSSPSLKNIEIDGSLLSDALEITLPDQNIRISGKRIRADYSGHAELLSHETLSGSKVSASVYIGKGYIKGDSTDMEIDRLRIQAASKAVDLNMLQDETRIPYTLRLSSGRMSLSDRPDSLAARIDGLSIKMSADCIGPFRPGSSLQADIRTGECSLTNPSASIGLSKLNIGLDTKRFRGKTSMKKENAIQSGATYSRQEYLAFQLPSNARNILDSWLAKANIKTGNGSIAVASYPVPIQFSDLDIYCDTDSLNLRDASVRSGKSAMRLNGYVSNMRKILTIGTPQRIPAKLNIEIDTLDFNHIASSYEQGQISRHGQQSVIPRRPDTIPASDTMTMLIPRNLDIDITASAKETAYTNLRLYDLSADLGIHGGKATVKNLNIASDFGHASLNLTYDTRDVSRPSLSASAGVMQIDVVRFFENFHSLIEMMPQMRNLSGIISAEINGGVDFFPDMYLNLPSLHADMAVQGRQLKVHQNKFIRRITRMMLIPDSHDIHIRNMDVHASVHDNLLELYPFNFEFSNYRLRMEGLNNFNGMMYYHIGIPGNPIHLPFGINITGHFSDPHLSFGGATFKEKHAFDITGRVMTSKNINIVSEMRYYLQEFIHKAAVSVRKL